MRRADPAEARQGPGPAAGLTRRVVLRGAAAAAVGAGAVVAAACGRALQGPQPTPQGARIVLKLQPNGTLPFNNTTKQLYQQALQPFYAKNPGVDVQLVPPAWGANVQAILGGHAPDIISDNYPPPYLSPSAKLLVDLDPYVKRENIDVSKWSSGQVNSFSQAAADHGLYMLPAYFSPLIYIVRLSDFDAAGIPHPDPQWTHDDFARICKQLTRTTGGKKRYGAVIEWDSNVIGEGTWPFWAFGNGTQDSSGHAVLSGDRGLQAGTWLYEQLFWPGYASTRDKLGPWYNTNEFTTGQVSMQLVWDGLVLDNAQRFNGFQWDYAPPPVFPQGPTCMGTDDFYAIAATTTAPEAAWALLKFLTYDESETGWQRSVMKIGLLQPSLNSLWDVWMGTVRAVAPILNDKHLEYFKELAVSGRAFPEQYWRLADGPCKMLTTPHMNALWAQKVDVPTAFAAMDQQINALLEQATAAASGQAKAAQAIAAITPAAGVDYPAPVRGGAGAPSSPADSLMAQDKAAGTWTMLGDGDDVSTVSDNCTFAAVAAPQSAGTWRCRVAVVSNISCAKAGRPELSPWLKVGLMARGDLSDDAPFVSIHVTGGNQLEVQNRGIPGVAPSGQGMLAPVDGGGRVVQLMSPVTQVATNYLLAPVWLQMTRQGLIWTLSASLDGQKWQALGGTQRCPGMGGAWVGLMCCAHNADFGDLGYIRTVIDNVSFQPTELVQLGTLGIPPAAGPVPGTWAAAPPPAAPSGPSPGTGASASGAGAAAAKP